MSTDLRALGRLSESLDARPGPGGRRHLPVRRGRGPARRRPRVPRSALAVLAVAGAAAAWLGLAISDAGDTPPADSGTAVEVPARPPGGDSTERASRGDARAATTFAHIDGVALSMPHPAAVLVAFGEGERAEALALEPVGRLRANEHHRYEPKGDTRGPEYVVLASEGRPRAATSGVDVVVPAEDPTVLAPVSGRVADVREYAMEGGVRDYRVVIDVGDRPSLSVAVVHLEEPYVAEGDEVQAGTTPVGAARLLPFRRGVDAHVDGRLPHVHLEVRPAGEPAPLDPNQPAAPSAVRGGR